MTALSELGARELVWHFPNREGQAFELRSDGDEFGWLRFDDENGNHATGELNGHKWRFEHTPGPHPRVRISRESDSAPVAEFAPRLTGGGTVEFAGGARYCWNRAKIWSPRWCFRLEGQSSSICVFQESGPLRQGGRVSVCGEAAKRPETPVLVLLAWYLRVLSFETLVESVPGVG